MLVSRKTGIVVYEDESSGSHEVRAWGRRMALYKECGLNVFRVDAFHDGDNDKKYKKFIRKNTRFLQELFGSDVNVLSIDHDGHGLKICLDEDVCKMVSAEVRSEIYVPVAYERNGVVAGGMYAYIWRCDAVDLDSSRHESLIQRPVMSIVTGMCMFGANIWGIDQHGSKHPLTNTFYVMPKDACIESILLDSALWHPYENMMLRLFDLQIPMFKAMGRSRQKVFFQSVFEEYVLYGFQMFLLGHMSLSALCAYVDHVRTRALQIREQMARKCKKHEVDFDNGESTLAIIFGGELDPLVQSVEVVERFINLHEVDVAQLQGKSFEQRLELVEQVFWRCMTKLSTQVGSAGHVWRHVHQILLANQRDNTSKYDFSSLLTLNFLNYSAKIAIVRKDHPEGELCLSHPFHEKPMALAYKELHAEMCGGILSVNWIPPIFAHEAFKSGLYYLERGKDVLNDWMASGLLDWCGLDVGAEALKDLNLKREAARQLDAILYIGDGRSMETM